MIILGIESSCDETSVGIVKDGHIMLANIVASSMDLHAKYGGVIPEIAARSHLEVIMTLVDEALVTAQLSWDDIDGIAVTHGAGLLGSVLIGVLAARTLAIVKRKPLYGINHVEAHIYANFLTHTPLPTYQMRSLPIEFPMLGIIVSGNHSQLAVWEDHFKYSLLGQTRDDAIGEAFDKVARLLGLPYPGGVNVSRLAEQGNPRAYHLPKARLSGPYDFSFSGLKTAVLRLCQDLVGADYSLSSWKLPEMLNDQQKADVAACFTATAVATIVDKAVMAFEEFHPRSVVMGGGVAANQELRRQLAERLPIAMEYPDLKLCGDNGAMVATLGCYKAMLGAEPADPYKLEAVPNLSM